MKHTRHIVRTSFKILAGTLLFLVVFVLALWFWIQTDSGKDFLRRQAEQYLEKKLNTRVRIGRLDYDIPSRFKLEDVFLADRQQDTLLYLRTLAVDMNGMGLLKNRIELSRLHVDGLYLNTYTSSSSDTFNYQFVMDAFANDSETAPADSKPWSIEIGTVAVTQFRLHQHDRFQDQLLTAGCDSLLVAFGTIRPELSRFDIQRVSGSGIRVVMDDDRRADPAAAKPAEESAGPDSLTFTLASWDLKDTDLRIRQRRDSLLLTNRWASLQGSQLKVNLDKHEVTLEDLRMEQNQLSFRHLPLTTTSPSAEQDAPNPWKVQVKQLSLLSSSVSYDDLSAPIQPGLDPSHIRADSLNVVMQDFRFQQDSLALRLNHLCLRERSGLVVDSARLSLAMGARSLSVDELLLKTPHSRLQSRMQYTFEQPDDLVNHPERSQIRLNIDSATLSAKDLVLLSPDLAGQLPPAFVSGPPVKLSTALRGNTASMHVDQLDISALSGTRLRLKGQIGHLTDLRRLNYNLNDIQATVVKKDATALMPKGTDLSLWNDLPATLNVKGSLRGNLKETRGQVKATGQGFRYDGLIVANNLSQPDQLKLNVDTRELTLSTALLNRFIPEELKQQVRMPATLSYSGSLKGNADDLNADMVLRTDWGILYLKGFLQHISHPERARYDMTLRTPGFRLGTFLRQDSLLGAFRGELQVRGQGTDEKTLTADLRTQVDKIELNGYAYQQLTSKVRWQRGEVSSQGILNDPHLKLSYTLQGDMNGAYPTADIDLRLDTANLFPLGFSQDTLDMSGIVRLQARSLKPGALDASLRLQQFHAHTPQVDFPVYEASLVALSNQGVDSLVLQSPFAEAEMVGEFDYETLPAALLAYLSRHCPLNLGDTAASPGDHQVRVKGHLHQDSILSRLLPDDIRFNDVRFSGAFDSRNPDHTLTLALDAPGIQYGVQSIQDIRLEADGGTEGIDIQLRFDTLQAGSYTFERAEVNGRMAYRVAAIRSRMKDSEGRNWFGLEAEWDVQDSMHRIRLTDDLLLNYEYWSISDKNEIWLSPEGFRIHRFLLSNDTSLIYVNSENESWNSRVLVDVDNFNLKGISSLIHPEPDFIAGVVDLKMQAGGWDQAIPSFTGEAEVSGLAYMNYPVGHLQLSAWNPSEREIQARLRLTESGNDATLSLSYFTDDTDRELDAELKIGRLTMKTIEAFSEGQLADGAGFLHGAVSLSGQMSRPHWEGALMLDSIAFRLPMLGPTYRIHNQRIMLKNPSITLDRIEVTDSLGHRLLLTGGIDLLENNDLRLGINILADDFVLLNARRTSESEFFGYAAADIRVRVRGTMGKPVIEGDVNIDDNSDMTMVMLDGGYVKTDGNTIVRFVDADTFRYSNGSEGFLLSQKNAPDFSTFLNYNVNLQVGKNASFRIILDPATGDEIKVQGNANLNAGVDPGGNLQLTGNYELSKGYYLLNYQFLKRQFQLAKGSSIGFVGNPDDARLNITAEYLSQAAPYDLLVNQTNDIDAREAQTYKQRIPFKVLLKITGILSKPVINFDIELPEASGTVKIPGDMRNLVDGKLNQLRQDQALLNKQVFSLLLMNKFMTEQSADFLKSSTTDFSSMARNSLGGFLSSALNEIAGDVLKGIDVDLNLNSYNDFSSGSAEQRTDLNVAITKSFFNNRVTISVGNSFGLNGQNSASRPNNAFRPDLNLSYRLSKDGKYLLNAYTRNQYEVVLDGFVAETGLSFMITLDYETFREFFKKENP